MMKLMKVMAATALVAGAMIAGGCSNSCGGCKPAPTEADCRCNYCDDIGSKMCDERVRNGEEVTFEDGITVRSYPKDKITKWGESSDSKPAAKPVAEPVAAPAEESKTTVIKGEEAE